MHCDICEEPIGQTIRVYVFPAHTFNTLYFCQKHYILFMLKMAQIVGEFSHKEAQARKSRTH